MCWLQADAWGTTGALQMVIVTLPLREHAECDTHVPNPQRGWPVPQILGGFKKKKTPTFPGPRLRRFPPWLRLVEGVALAVCWPWAGVSDPLPSVSWAWCPVPLGTEYPYQSHVRPQGTCSLSDTGSCVVCRLPEFPSLFAGLPWLLTVLCGESSQELNQSLLGSLLKESLGRSLQSL